MISNYEIHVEKVYKINEEYSYHFNIKPEKGERKLPKGTYLPLPIQIVYTIVQWLLKKQTSTYHLQKSPKTQFVGTPHNLLGNNDVVKIMRLFPLSSTSEKEESGRATLYLNVYDLTPVNNYLYWFGLGVFHSGIEVHGMEFGFGAHEYSSSGVFEVEPKSCPGFIFRRSVSLGTTDKSPAEIRSFMEHLSTEYHGDTYHLIAKNCNHFTEEVCVRLTGKPIPGWVNRLARVGSFCNCLLPENIQVTAVRHLPDHPEYSDDDGSESVASSISAESETEDSNHHLLTTPNGEVAFLKEKPVRLTKEHL